MVFHFLQALGGVAHPAGDFAHDPERLTGAVGLRRVSRKFLVPEIGIVHDRAGRLHNVDPFPSVSVGQLGAPDGRVQRAGEIDPRCLFPRAVIGAVANPDQISRFQVGSGAVIESLRSSTHSEPLKRAVLCTRRISTYVWRLLYQLLASETCRLQNRPRSANCKCWIAWSMPKWLVSTLRQA